MTEPSRQDDQAVAEALDDDKLSAEYPPDRPLGVDDYGITPGEERTEEPLAERVAREQPDVAAGDVGEEVGDIASGDSTTRDLATERVVDQTAEEAAVHLTDEPER